MWKLVQESAIGTSHNAEGIPCQDACRSALIEHPSQQVLVACVADGAGSSSMSQIGAEIACDTFIRSATEMLPARPEELLWDELFVKDWLRDANLNIAQRARDESLPIREFACTFLAALVGETGAIFAQVGDGAMVIDQHSGYETIFWPQSGEYANLTNFLTDEHFTQQIETRFVDRTIQRLAMFSDGLERLVLKFEEMQVHAPFLNPLFLALESSEDGASCKGPLQTLLCSQKINVRTHDDKTLLLASRRSK